jgi:hypothetical protein
MSKIEVNAVEPQCGTNLTLGASGDTIIIPAGATISNAGTAAGFGSTGEVSWDTTKKTTGFTAVSGVGYFCDTTSAGFTVTLPASPSAGNVVAVSDYTGTFATNNLTIGRNGSNINGNASDYGIFQDNTTAQFIYVDATEGWRLVFTGANSDVASNFIVATGGCISYSGDYKIHTFTGPGTFTVSSAGTPIGSTTVDYLVVAGGGGGGSSTGDTVAASGGGAGGYRESSGAASGCYTVSPLGSGVSALPISSQAYPITVGAGGAGGTNPNVTAVSGNSSIFSTITSTGGGKGSNQNTYGSETGGSGGGGSWTRFTGANGNTPPVSPPQGNPGSEPGSGTWQSGGGGGGATTPGGAGAGSGGNGGAGATSSINGTPTARAGGGGGGGGYPGTSNGGGIGGDGGGGYGGAVIESPANHNGTSGTTNTGSGGGGGGGEGNNSAPYSLSTGGAGGSGIVIIRYKYQ